MTFLSEFKNKWNNKSCDFDGWYGHQCVDLANQYRLELTGLNPNQNIHLSFAYQIFQEPRGFFNSATRYERIFNDYNDANQVPRNGDLIVWNTNFGGGAGHIAIVTDAQPSNFEVLEQNAGNGDGKGSDDFTKLSRYRDYSNVLGWLRIIEPDPNYQPQPVQIQTPVEVVNPCQSQDNRIQELNNQNEEKTKTIDNLKRENLLLSTEKTDIQFNLNAKEKIMENLQEQLVNYKKGQDEDIKRIEELKLKLSTEIKDKKEVVATLQNSVEKWNWSKFIIGQLRSGTLPAIILSTIGTMIYFITDKLSPNLSETIRNNYPIFASTYLLPIVGLIIKNLINLVDKNNK